MNKLSAKELAMLVSETQTLLGLYYHKDKWKSIFPTISHLSEKFDHFFESNPNAMQAQLCFYLEKQGYTTNLVINQIIIVLSICQSLGINHVIRQQLIAACLCQYICIQKESNAIASNQKISSQGLKLYQQRNTLALKLMNYAKVPQGIIHKVFNNLTLYKQVISGKKHSVLIDINTLIISISTLLSKEITLAKNHKAKSLTAAISSLYIASDQSNVQTILKRLLNYLPCIMPGTKISIKPDCYHIGQFYKKDKLINLSFTIPEGNNSSKGRFSFTKDQTEQNRVQHICHDQGIIFKIWFEPLTSITSKNELLRIENLNSKVTLDNIESLKICLNAKKHHSIEELCEQLNDYPHISQSLCFLASKANRTEQQIESIRHAIMMLGANRTPLLIQKIILELQLDALGITQWFNLKDKVQSLMLASEQAAQEIYDFLPEEASLCILNYCYAVLSEKNNQIYTLSANKGDISQGSPFLIETLLGIKNTDEHATTDSHNVMPQPWHDAIHNLKKKSAHDAISKPSNHLYCLGIALLCINKIYEPDYDFDAYANEFIAKAVKSLKLKSVDKYLNTLLELNFYDRIDIS
jgi:hypothetical protein